MRIGQVLRKVKAPGVAILAAVVAFATVSPGGAAIGSASAASNEVTGRAFATFIETMVDEALNEARMKAGSNQDAIAAIGSIAETVRLNVRAHLGTQSPATQSGGGGGQTNAAALPIPLPNLPELPELPEIPLPTPGSEAPDAQDVIDALLALLNGAQLDVLAALNIAEQAFLAMIDDAKAKAVAAFATGDFGELETFVIEKLDWARGLVQQAFAMIRAQINAMFVDVRNKIIEEITGVDFGDTVDEVLAEIQKIRDYVNFLIGRVNEVIGNLIGNLPSTGS